MWIHNSYQHILLSYSATTVDNRQSPFGTTTDIGTCCLLNVSDKVAWPHVHCQLVRGDKESNCNNSKWRRTWMTRGVLLLTSAPWLPLTSDKWQVKTRILFNNVCCCLSLEMWVCEMSKGRMRFFTVWMVLQVIRLVIYHNLYWG